MLCDPGHHRRALAFGLLLFASLASACTGFDALERGECGNGLIEPGEDCDSDDPSCVRCAVTCTVRSDCPSADYTCGADGVCHAPGGALGAASAPVAFQVDDLRVTDINRDGTGDVLGLSSTSLVVRYGDPAGALSAVDSFVTPAQAGPPAFGDLDGDGSIDVTVATVDGLVSFTSRFGVASPVDIASPILDEEGRPLDFLQLFSVGPFQLGGFIVVNDAVFLIVVDLLTADEPFATAPCAARLGAIPRARFAIPTVDIYRASAKDALTADFVVSFTTDAGALCATSIHGNSLAGFTFADITPIAAVPLQHRPVLADLDTDADPCPSLINSDGGAAGLRLWKGRLAAGRCTLDPAGPAGAPLPALPDAPSSARAVGRFPIVPPLPGLASDAVVMTSGVYAHAPAINAMAVVYESARRLATVAIGDLDRDGDTDAVLAAADQDDLDLLYRFPLGLELLRVDTASRVTTITIGDYDGNSIADIAYTEASTDHQAMMVAYGTPDRPLPPVQVATFTGVASVTPIQFPDSVDTLAIAEDLAVIQPSIGGAAPTITLLHGSPQRTMLSLLDPRSDAIRPLAALRGAVLGDFADSLVHHTDLLALTTPEPGEAGPTRSFLLAGTASGLADAPSDGVPTSALADCEVAGGGVCVEDALLLAWPIAPRHDVVLAIDRAQPPRATRLDPWSGALVGTAIPELVAGLPAGAVARSLHAADLDGDGAPELIASFAAGGGDGPGGGSVRACAVTDGVPGACSELAPVVAAIAPDIAACSDAAPGRFGYRDVTAPGPLASDLVVLCHDRAGQTALFRVAREAGDYRAELLASGAALRALRTGDVTGDGVDDVIAVQGAAGARALVVFPQCSSRELATCRGSAAAAIAAEGGR